MHTIIQNLEVKIYVVRYDSTHTSRVHYAAKQRTSTRQTSWTATNNFSQVQFYTPWWWLAYDPKHVWV